MDFLSCEFEEQCVVIGCREVALAASLRAAVSPVACDDLVGTCHLVILTRPFVGLQLLERGQHRLGFLVDVLPHPLEGLLCVEYAWMDERLSLCSHSGKA